MKTKESVEQQIFVLERIIEKSKAAGKIEYALIKKVKRLKEDLEDLNSSSWQNYLSK